MERSNQPTKLEKEQLPKTTHQTLKCNLFEFSALIK